jgi:hypothetical protein
MSRVSEWVRKYGVGGLSAVAVVAFLAVGALAVAGGGAAAGPSRAVVALAADDDGTPDQGPGDVGSTTAPTTPTTGVPATTSAPATTAVPSTVPPAAGTRAIPVPGVGLVIITEQPLGLVSATPSAGFTARVESSTREVHVRFVGADGRRIDVQAEIEDGAVRVRVRGASVGTTPSTDVTVPTSMPATTVPGFDDHGGRGNDDTGFDDHGGDDRSGHGGDDSGSDDSGSDDSGSDDHGGNSGHGGGDD